MDYDYKILEEKMKSLPKELKFLLTSPGIANSVKKISKDHKLMIDQESVLFDQISYVILGLTSSKDFVRNLSKEAKMDDELARVVSEDINKEIFAQVKSAMTAMQNTERIPEPKNTEKDKLSISTLERIGGFSVEKEAPEPGNNGLTSADRVKVLEGLESTLAKMPVHTGVPPINLPIVEEIKEEENGGPSGQTTTTQTPAYIPPIKKPVSVAPGNHREPLVDYLLSDPTAQPKQNIVAPAPQGQQGTPNTIITPSVRPTPPRSGADPYKESV